VSTKIPLLVLNSLSSAHQAQIAEVYDMTYAFGDAQRAAAIAEHGKKFRAVLTIGVIGLTPDELAAMPKVELPPGSYWTQKANEMHDDACLSDTECVILLINDAPYETYMAK